MFRSVFFSNSSNEITLYGFFQLEVSQIAVLNSSVNIHAFVKPILDSVECWQVFIEHHATNYIRKRKKREILDRWRGNYGAFK